MVNRGLYFLKGILESEGLFVEGCESCRVRVLEPREVPYVVVVRPVLTQGYTSL